MVIEANELWRVLIIGSGATLVMDLWNLALKHTLHIKSLNYCLLGRWLCHMPSGTFKHESINTASHKPLECLVGWTAHYTIGIVFVYVFVRLASSSWIENPALAPALLYGLATVVFPLFVMQPALGFGIAASNTPNPAMARLKSLGTHAVFGLGIYLSAIAL